MADLSRRKALKVVGTGAVGWPLVHAAASQGDTRLAAYGGSSESHPQGEDEMPDFEELVQSANWEEEKHVPVIKCPDEVKAGEYFDVKISVGEAIAHPNTTEHHIRWIKLYIKPETDAFLHQVGLFEFNSHGESVQGANEGPVWTNHQATCSIKTEASGTLYALAYCNIHGVWKGSKELKVS